MILLAIDIGNTNINCAFFKGDKIFKRFSLSTQAYSYIKMKKLIGRIAVNQTIVCSVVPKVSRRLIADLKKLTKKHPFVLGSNLIAPVKNAYRKPRQVGQDRLANAFAAIKLFGCPLIIIDFGTALTIDIVSKNKEYLGGVILPGLKLCLSALAENTALLPKIGLAQPKELIARDTKDSMLSGIVYGFAGLVDNLIEKLRKEIGKNTLVIGTGGDINLLRKYCKKFDKIDDALTLKGLNMIFKKIQGKSHHG